jgi:hemin uptake protein HemP
VWLKNSRTRLIIIGEMIPSNPQDRKGAASENEPAIVSSQDLLGGHRQLIIRHGREQYRLQLTNSNKLILTK